MHPVANFAIKLGMGLLAFVLFYLLVVNALANKPGYYDPTTGERLGFDNQPFPFSTCLVVGILEAPNPFSNQPKIPCAELGASHYSVPMPDQVPMLAALLCFSLIIFLRFGSESDILFARRYEREKRERLAAEAIEKARREAEYAAERAEREAKRLATEKAHQEYLRALRTPPPAPTPIFVVPAANIGQSHIMKPIVTSQPTTAKPINQPPPAEPPSQPTHSPPKSKKLEGEL